jgi:hypothetical protein
VLQTAACRYHQVDSRADVNAGWSLTVNFWQESLWGWALSSDQAHRDREAAIHTRGGRNDQFASVAWESFMD